MSVEVNSVECRGVRSHQRPVPMQYAQHGSIVPIIIGERGKRDKSKGQNTRMYARTHAHTHARTHTHRRETVAVCVCVRVCVRNRDEQKEFIIKTIKQI